jgi:hypothetical protein
MSRARVKRVGAAAREAAEGDVQSTVSVDLADGPDIAVQAFGPMADGQYIEIPIDWRPGMLLNVRNNGDAYMITLYPEEVSAQQPQRALRFTNPGECQEFVSKWYANQNHDPRAR